MSSRNWMQEAVEAGQEIGQVVADARVGARRVTELRHQAGRAQAVPADVADRQHDPPVGKEEGVVPVAADLAGVVFGGEIPRGDVERRKLGKAGPISVSWRTSPPAVPAPVVPVRRGAPSRPRAVR